jgi:carotenoid cleavage dioxygenase-like enzyme
MFDGYGFLSRLRVQEGKAWGNKRYVQSKALQAYKAQGGAAWKLPESLSEPQIGRLVCSAGTPVLNIMLSAQRHKHV